LILHISRFGIFAAVFFIGTLSTQVKINVTKPFVYLHSSHEKCSVRDVANEIQDEVNQTCCLNLQPRASLQEGPRKKTCMHLFEEMLHVSLPSWFWQQTLKICHFRTLSVPQP